MKTLTRVALRPGVLGEALPVAWPILHRHGIRPRRGQVTMIAALPNGGKSMFALVWAIRLKLPTLYISADTDEWTTVVRALASLTGYSQEVVEEGLRNPDARAYYEDFLAELRDIRFSFETDPEYRDIYLEVRAFEELYGEYPALIIIDNLMNVISENENEYSGMKEVTKFLHRLARQTNAAVFVLHHVNESDRIKPNQPPPRHAITGKVNQLPERILTIAMDRNQNLLRIAQVKSRDSAADESGEVHVALHVDAASMQLIDRSQYG